MDDRAFEAALRRDGFQEVLRRTLPPGDALPEHHHAWDVRGLVVSGRFRVWGPDGDQDCGPGEVFTLPIGQPHEEAAGPEGAALVIGRRYRG
ncbi:MAG: cupin domain-containing protein [Acetobacteraceae bacterium]|nr:cupin domain-containing protein [Acetobacteraceae bacterium]